jgi:hypothetical protein
MGERRRAFWVWRGNLREGDHVDDPGVDGKIILNWICEKCDEGTDWIDLAKDRDMWRAVVSAVMDIHVP